MANGIEISQLHLPEHKDLALEVADLVCSEVCRIDFKPSMFSKYKKIIRNNAVIAAQDSSELLVATGTVMLPKSKEASITDVATLQSHRGMGIGRMVVSELESIARAMGADRTTLVPLSAATGFYERLGYENVSNGTSMMAKSLV